MKTVLLLAAYALLPLILPAQHITVGDRMPDLELENVLNTKDGRFRFADYRGKIIVIEFWNHKCAPCINKMPDHDRLQRAYKDILQVIYVNAEDRQSTLELLQKTKSTAGISMPIATGDTLLQNIFPIRSFPCSVWIDSLGIIRNFTNALNLGPQHLKTFREKGRLSVTDATAARKDSPTSTYQFEYCSYIAYCGGFSPMQSTASSAIAVECLPIPDLFSYAYRKQKGLETRTSYNFMLKVKDSSRFLFPENDEQKEEWSLKNCYNYELVLPAARSASAYSLMQQDLERFFNVKASIREVKMKSIVLTSSKGLRWKRRLQKPLPVIAWSLLAPDTSLPVEQFIQRLNLSINYYFPFFNELKGKLPGSVQFRNRGDQLDLGLLRQDLQQIGLDLVWKERAVPVLVLEEK